MRFVCDSCRAQYMISDDKVGAKGVKVRCKKCGYVILVRKAEGNEETTQVTSMPMPPAAIPPEADAGEPASPSMSPTNGLGEAVNGASGETAEAPQNGAHPVEPPAPGAEEGVGAPVTSFGGNGQSMVLGGVEDDEIGAVFDQVLKTAPQKVQPDRQMLSAADVGLSLEEHDDLSSTRVVPADALRKLARESVQITRGEGQADEDGGGAGGENGSSVPENDWFVAVDDQQQGPIALEKLKDMWERGELGADSLCWRAGYSDWTPLSEVEALKQVLAPKPQKPVIAAAPAMMGPASGPAVLTMPVEALYSAGGLAQSVRAEVPVMASAPAAETGGWQPSAASALASLVKEEMSVLSKPAPAKRSLLEISQNDAPAEHGSGGLLDLPSAPPDPAPAGVNGRASGGFLDVPAPVAPAPSHAAPAPLAAAPAYAASPYPAYVPAPAQQTGMSRGLIVALGVVAFLLLATIGTVLFVFLRTPGNAPSAPTEKVALEMPPPPAGLRESPAAASPPSAPASAPAPTSPAAEAPPPAPSPAPVPAPAPSPPPSAPLRRARGSDGSSRGDDGETTPRSRGSTGSSPKESHDPDDDEFNTLFGKPGKGSSNSTSESGTSKRTKGPYIPPEPGSGGDLRDSLGTSDVMQVVLANKPKIVECVNQQKEKQPGLSGKLVMKWTILPSGRTTGVSVQSEELRSTYMASCISSLIKGMSFPKHRVQGQPIVFPFTF